MTALLVKQTVDSTNAELARALLGGYQPLGCMAWQQTQGKGRYQRPWQSLDGNLNLSLPVIADRQFQPNWPSLSLVCAAAVAETLRNFTSQPFGIKWPNDVLLHRKKVAGILLETVHLPSMVVLIGGIGLNVKQAPALSAIALAEVMATLPAMLTIVHALLERLATLVQLWQQQPQEMIVGIEQTLLLKDKGLAIRPEPHSEAIPVDIIGLTLEGYLIAKPEGTDQAQTWIHGEIAAQTRPDG